MASASLGLTSLAELARAVEAEARHAPATRAPSASLALIMDKWKAHTGADLVRVPFRGGAEAVNGVLSGATPVAFFGLANWIALLRAGQVRGLAIDSAQRSPLFPDIPTLSELGYGPNPTRIYFGIVAPAGTPSPIIQKLAAEFARIGADAEFRQKRLVENGARAGVRHAARLRPLPRRAAHYRQTRGAGVRAQAAVAPLAGFCG